MRTFNFKAKNIGNEKYLSYTMDDDCDLDEDALDYCEENNLKELIEIIYEEDDDYDYLTYNITNKVSIEEYIKNEMNPQPNMTDTVNATKTTPIVDHIPSLFSCFASRTSSSSVAVLRICSRSFCFCASFSLPQLSSLVSRLT